ncbi:hypothetical protein FGRMN_8120 [Fusarium graminum]|nr:hypothetical protein FGRMN_8120 [Fusarium graminum]
MLDAECYVNQKSVCNEDSSVLCTNLQSGTEKACCPKLTICDPDVEASKDSVRCHIDRKDLVAAMKASTTSSLVTADISSEPNPRTIESNLAASDKASPDTSQTGLTGGMIAGIVLGALAGGLLILSLVVWLLKRNGRAENQIPKQLMAMTTSTLRTRTRGRGIGRKSWAHWEDIDYLQK